MSAKLISEAYARSARTIESAQELYAIWEPHELSTPALIHYLAVSLSRAEEALKKIANGEGYYGAQAREYKQIAKAALDALPCPDERQIISTDGSK